MGVPQVGDSLPKDVLLDENNIKNKVIEVIACVSVNDSFVMDAFGKSLNAEGKIRMLAYPRWLTTTRWWRSTWSRPARWRVALRPRSLSSVSTSAPAKNQYHGKQGTVESTGVVTLSDFTK